LVHVGLAAFHQGKSAQEALLAAATELAGKPGSLSAADVENLETAHGLAQAMCLGYAAHYKGGKDFQQVEIPFEFPIGNEHHLTGTIDGLKTESDDLWVVEHKTTSDFSQPYFDAASISTQIMGYMVGARKLTGRWPKGVIYNVIFKSALRQRTKEDRPEFFKRVHQQYLEEPTEMFRRVPIVVPKRQLASYMADLSYITHQIAEAVANMERLPEAFYPNTGTCLRGRSPCQHLPTCSAYQDRPDPHFWAVSPEDIVHV